MAKLSALFVLAVIGYVAGHGMLLEPVGRASRWRYDSSAPANYNDNEVWCGGLGAQHHTHGGRCGLCGDNFGMGTPRPHENGGQFGRGVIVARFQPGGVVRAGIRITANHRGHFTFHLCNLDNSRETDDCYNRNLIRLTNGADRFTLTDFSNRMFYVDLRLPQGLTCRHCVLRWNYQAANNWGTCQDGSGAVGCGPQENYRSCSDISINWGREAYGSIYANQTAYLGDIKEHEKQMPMEIQENHV